MSTEGRVASARELGSMAGLQVAVVGGGNAALCAALSAREQGAAVLVLERDAEATRGGNSKYTRNLRVVTGEAGGYGEDEFLEDLGAVTGEGFDLELARFTIAESATARAWMERHGVHWQPALRGTLDLQRTNRFFLGGGKALLNTYYQAAERAGVAVRYQALVEDVEPGPAGLRLRVLCPDGSVWLRAAAVVVASGGFESNLDWLRRYWGDLVDGFVVRGTSCNDGRLLAALLERGALAKGNPRGFHAVAVDARSPRYDGGLVTRVDAIPFGIVVNRQARRFYDEGEDRWPKRYATWGRLVAEQPGQFAVAVFDGKAQGRFIPGAYPAFAAASLEELAPQVELDPAALRDTVAAYNRAVPPGPDGDFGPWSTRGLDPPKSSWAAPIDTPPYMAYPLRPGITFTYLGVGVDRQARVLSAAGGIMPGLFAAGEVMAGNLLLRGYLAGFGMTLGTVFGRIAGREAAAHAA